MGFKVTTGKTSKKDDQISGYIDEHKQKLHIKVSLENQDTVYPISDAKLTILVIGKSPESGKEAIVYKKQFSGINLPINEEKVLRVINLSYGMTTEARCMVINTKAALLFLKTLRVRYLVKRRFQEQRPNIWKRRKN